jgi:hypothetical protein
MQLRSWYTRLFGATRLTLANPRQECFDQAVVNWLGICSRQCKMRFASVEFCKGHQPIGSNVAGIVELMPRLKNPRHEAFAFALFEALCRADRQTFSQGRAYQRAGYLAKDAGKPGGSAETCAARLLKKVQPISDRVQELLEEQAKRIQPKLDISKERIGRRLDLASRMAEEQKNPMAIGSNEMALAKLFGHFDKQSQPESQSFADAKSMRDIGIMLLSQVGVLKPSDADIAAAIEAHDRLIAALEAIAHHSQTLVLEQK